MEYRLSLIPFGGYVALPQLADMGRLEGKEDNPDDDPEKVETTDIQAAWKDFEEEENEEDAPRPSPKLVTRTR